MLADSPGVEKSENSRKVRKINRGGEKAPPLDHVTLLPHTKRLLITITGGGAPPPRRDQRAPPVGGDGRRKKPPNVQSHCQEPKLGPVTEKLCPGNNAKRENTTKMAPALGGQVPKEGQDW